MAHLRLRPRYPRPQSGCGAAPLLFAGVLLFEIVTGEVPLRGRLAMPQVPEQCPQVGAGVPTTRALVCLAVPLWQARLSQRIADQPVHKQCALSYVSTVAAVLPQSTAQSGPPLPCRLCWT